ncbi:MAG: CarD family transcriptional regulator, partial [Gemmatimonadales bacterium]
MLPHLIEEFRTLPQYRRLLRAMPARGTTLCAGQLPGSSPSVLVAALAEDNPQRVFVLLAESAAAAERLLADLQVLAPAPTRLYPQREALGEEEPHFEIAGERVETLQALVEGRARIVVTTLRATAELTPTPASLSRNRMMLSVGEVEEFGKCVAAVEQLGYQRVPSVRDVAQFAVRGGIIDLYGFGMSAPARIEWWGNDITSIRYFDLDSQRSEQETESVMILPVGTTQRPDESDRRQRQSLFDILPPDSLAVSFGANETPEIERLWQETAHHLDLAERRGEHVEPRESLFLSPDAWVAARQRLGAVRIAPGPGDVNFGLRSPPQIERDIKKLKRLVEAGRVLILCDNEGQIERLEELLADDRASAPATPHRNATIALGSLHGGFGLPELEVLTDHEVFSRARRIRRSRRYRQALRAADEALKPGDYVVHLEHGIGIYRSINTIVVGDGGEIEVAVIEYEGGDRLNVPLYRIDQIERYRPPDSGSGGAPPRLHSLGGKRWLRQRKKTESAIRKMAAELIELYAQRSVAKGFAFPPDGKWQIELESSFLYEDTPDQRRAAEDVKRDMEQAKVMDRLVEFPLLHEHDAEVVVRHRGIWIFRERIAPERLEAAERR